MAKRVFLFKQLRSLLLNPTPVLVRGDINCILPDENHSWPRNYNQSSTTSPLQFLVVPPLQHQWGDSSSASNSRIDMFLLSSGLRMCSLTSQVVRFSVHRMLTVSLDWEGLVRVGRKTWRVNDSVFQNPAVSLSRCYLK